MPIRRQNYSVRRGETLAIDLVDIVDENGNVPSSLAGWDARMQARPNEGAPPVIDTIGVPMPGKFRLSATTNSVPVGTYIYDIRVQAASGFVSYPVEGTITVTQPATQSP